jgi:hypothetical protein
MVTPINCTPARAGNHTFPHGPALGAPSRDRCWRRGQEMPCMLALPPNCMRDIHFKGGCCSNSRTPPGRPGPFQPRMTSEARPARCTWTHWFMRSGAAAGARRARGRAAKRGPPRACLRTAVWISSFGKQAWARAELSRAAGVPQLVCTNSADPGATREHARMQAIAKVGFFTPYAVLQSLQTTCTFRSSCLSARDMCCGVAYRSVDSVALPPLRPRVDDMSAHATAAAAAFQKILYGGARGCACTRVARRLRPP